MYIHNASVSDYNGVSLNLSSQSICQIADELEFKEVATLKEWQNNQLNNIENLPKFQTATQIANEIKRNVYDIKKIKELEIEERTIYATTSGIITSVMEAYYDACAEPGCFKSLNTQLNKSQLDIGQLNKSQLDNSQLNDGQLDTSQLNKSQSDNSQLNNSQFNNTQLNENNNYCIKCKKNVEKTQVKIALVRIYKIP